MPIPKCLQHGELASEVRTLEADFQGIHIGPLCERAWNELLDIVRGYGSGDIRAAAVTASKPAGGA